MQTVVAVGNFSETAVYSMQLVPFLIVRQKVNRHRSGVDYHFCRTVFSVAIIKLVGQIDDHFDHILSESKNKIFLIERLELYIICSIQLQYIHLFVHCATVFS